MVYAVHGSPEFNAMVDYMVRRIGATVCSRLGENFVALVLGGGYGRGEGGVLSENGREKLYNDLDLTLIVKRRNAVAPEHLKQISAEHEEECGVEVDFSRPLTERDIRNWPHWLMWTELLNGHRVICGDADILTRNAPARLAENPPPVEATRLLLNRGAGLLWALRVRRGFENAPDPDFVRRNYHKCAMALGDALLIVSGRHRTAYKGRVAEFTELCAEQEAIRSLGVLPAYRRALEFRKLPGPAQPDAFGVKELEEIADTWQRVFLLVEERRTAKRFANAEVYAGWHGLREPEQHAISCLPRNFVRNLQERRISLKYPREELYRQLPRLLSGPAENGWSEGSAAFLDSWSRYN